MTTLKPLQNIHTSALFEAFVGVGMYPTEALKDPVKAVRLASTCELEEANQFLRAVATDAPDLSGFEDEDEARIYFAGVFSQILCIMRRHYRRSGAVSHRAATIERGKERSYLEYA